MGIGRAKTILIAGEVGVFSAAIQLQLKKIGGVEVVTTDQAKENEFTPVGTCFQQRTEDLLIIPETVTISKTPFRPPLTRLERRAKNRKKP